jgi:MFS family permease
VAASASPAASAVGAASEGMTATGAPDAPGDATCARASRRRTPAVLAVWRHPALASLLGGGTAYFVGNAMQVMAGAWLVVELTGSDFLAALVQTAVFLPMFLLALPAGVLADTTDRQRLLVAALSVQVVAVALLALLLIAGWGGAATLLALTFVSGCCTAMLSPPWNSAVVDAVPREELPATISAISMAYNGARALGPALAGLVYASFGPGWVFLFTVAGVVALLVGVRRHPPRPHPPSRLPAERLWGGVLSALRFARHNDAVLAQLVRTMAYAATGSALWALLPVVAQRNLGLDARGFGLLMACMGGGAVAVGFVVARLRASLGLERLIALTCAVFALAMLVAAWLPWKWVAYPALAFAGAAWMVAMSTFNTATQTSAPPWVRARANGLHVLCSLGSFAIGSAVWGALSGLLGLAPTLTVAAAALLASALLARPFPLRMGVLDEVTQAPLSEDLFFAHQPEPEAGPVAVEIGYRVRADAVARFLVDVSLLRGPRRRDGATFWRLYRDLGDPCRYTERFIVTSWADYLHQRARATLADQELERVVREHLQPGEAPQVLHYIAER